MRLKKVNRYVVGKTVTEASSQGGFFNLPQYEYNNGNSSAAFTINLNKAQNQRITLNANCTLDFINPLPGFSYVLTLKQDGVGSRTVTWPSNVYWPFSVAPPLTVTPGRLDVINFYYNGTSFLGSFALNYNAP